MIYFLVNNSYHLDFDFPLIKELKNEKISLIIVPITFSVSDDNLSFFHKIYKFENNFNISYFNLFSLKRFMKIVDNTFATTSNDILLVHTDMVLLNQLLIYKFHKSNSKIFLLEDGTATMCDFNIEPISASIKSIIKCFILKTFLGIKNTNINKYGIQELYRLDDFLFNGLIVNFGLNTKRNIPVFQLKYTDKFLDIKFPKGAMFFNSPFYILYTNEILYFNFIKEILVISNNFNPFYFNFHPNDSVYFKDMVSEYIIHNYKNIILLPDGLAEDKINKYTTQFSISINSTASFNLIKKGIKPIFLNKIFLEKFQDPSFEQFELFLFSLGYISPKSIDEVSPLFYLNNFSLMDSNRFTLAEILKT